MFQTSLAVALLAAACCLSKEARAEASNELLVKDLSFEGPFEAFDVGGTRNVHGYRHGGNAEVKKNFVRLTAAREHQEGFLWSRNVINDNEWTAVLKFRISGATENLFGDGMAFWFTTDPQHRGGKVQGHNEFFTGFGVVLDTFVNAETAATHKDVSLLMSDGTQSVLKNPQHHIMGCDADFRYHEGRDDFSPSEHFAALKVVFAHGGISVYLDSKGQGEFKTCISGQQMPDMPNDWWTTAHHGVTAATGQMTDNHDVMSLQVWKGIVDVDVYDEQSPLDVAADWETGDAKVDNAIRAAVSSLEARLSERIQKLEHHLEHQLVAVQEDLVDMVKEVDAKENVAEQRLKDVQQALRRGLASEVGSKMSTQVESRLAVLELQLADSMKEHVASNVADVRSDLAGVRSRAEEAARLSAEAGGGWFLPFCVLLAVCGGVGFYAWRMQQKLRKSHLP